MHNKEETEDEEFARTGIFKFKMKIDIKITEQDLLKDLVKETEGKNVSVEKPNQN